SVVVAVFFIFVVLVRAGGSSGGGCFFFVRGPSNDPSLKSIRETSLVKQTRAGAGARLRRAASSLPPLPVHVSSIRFPLISAAAETASSIEFTKGETPACS